MKHTTKRTPTLKPNGEKFLVAWQMHDDLSKQAARLYREIDRIAAEMDFERIGTSVYVVNSDHAQIRAHVLAELASRYGAGEVGEKDGPTVWKLTEQEPQAYFDHRALACQVTDELLVDHRTRDNKRKARSIGAIVEKLRDPDTDDARSVTAALKRTTRSREKHTHSRSN